MIEIKLIIWDLDETFWNGTLSEEGVDVIEDNVNLIKRLTERGVINSISSKNNYDEAKKKLEKIGVWDYFVFPKIGWYSKGNAIKKTIEEMGLRPINVLFIDDNHLNLKEAEALLPEINVSYPLDFDFLEEKYDLKGKNDKELSRLKQYKLLEKKSSARMGFETDLDFLFSCNIKVKIIKANKKHLERIYELIQRTNQLNFTKTRISKAETEVLIQSLNVDCYVVFVSDKFGDYGLVGFVALDKYEHKLIHFCFSCRTINLGVEQFFYHYFKSPDVELSGETATKLLINYKPEWIVLDDSLLDQVNKNADKVGFNVLFKGGCDLSQMTFYLSTNNNVIEETNFVTKDNLPVHAEHSCIILNKSNYDSVMPYLPVEAFDSLMFKGDFDYVIYSVLMDYTQDLYKNKNGNVIPFGGYYKKVNLTSLSDENAIKMKSFYAEYENIGPIGEDEFYDNLERILHKLNDNTKIIIINGGEVAPTKNNEKGSVERHVMMNKVVDKFCEENNKRVFLIDMRKHITCSDDVTDNLRHYKRSVYQKIAQDVSEILGIKAKKGNADLIFFFKKLKMKIKKTLN